jgi:DNA-binding response OmpR family regulator
LRNYRILIADADIELSRVLKDMLSEMGFVNVHTTRSGKEAVSLLRASPFDFLITEWNTQHLDGIGLLEFLRKNPDSPNTTIPVIMLTGRAEVVDVYMARDYGINEYVVKPFTARSIYSRLERIIEQPRNFVIAPSFIGPCRRGKGKPPAGVERRERTPMPTLQPKDAKETMKGINQAGAEPKIFLPDFSLKLKLGKDVKLGDLITPAVLNQAQHAIDAITHDSLQWIRDNLREIKLLNDSMISGDYPSTITSDISDVALVINSRAGTFGYSRAGEIAYSLYLFSRNKLDPKNKNHHLVMQKHIEVLHVILGNQMRGNAGEVGAQIASELKSLIVKYS